RQWQRHHRAPYVVWPANVQEHPPMRYAVRRVDETATCSASSFHQSSRGRRAPIRGSAASARCARTASRRLTMYVDTLWVSTDADGFDALLLLLFSRNAQEKMMFCDDCDRGYHMYCLKPPYMSLPLGDWSCPDCVRRKPR